MTITGLDPIDMVTLLVAAVGFVCTLLAVFLEAMRWVRAERRGSRR